MKRSNAVSTPRVFGWIVSGSEGSVASPKRAGQLGAIGRTASNADQITIASHCNGSTSTRPAIGVQEHLRSDHTARLGASHAWPAAAVSKYIVIKTFHFASNR
jgi:hypothetical protein